MKNPHTCLNSVIYNDNSYEKLTSGKLRDFFRNNFVGTLIVINGGIQMRLFIQISAIKMAK